MRPSTLVRAGLLGLLGLFLSAAVTGCGQTANGQAKSTSDPTKVAALHQAMATLWQDHVLWTRLVIVSTAAGLGDLDPTTQRLLRNQTDIGNAVKPYYGDAAGDKLIALLRTHILGAAEVLAAAKANNSAKLETANTAWYANAKEIANFLSDANPDHWPRAEMESMMKEHLDLTLSEASHQLKGEFAESVADYDRVQDEILHMADALSDGIVAQFPDKFAMAPTP